MQTAFWVAGFLAWGAGCFTFGVFQGRLFERYKQLRLAYAAYASVASKEETSASE